MPPRQSDQASVSEPFDDAPVLPTNRGVISIFTPEHDPSNDTQQPMIIRVESEQSDAEPVPTQYQHRLDIEYIVGDEADTDEPGVTGTMLIFLRNGQQRFVMFTMHEESYDVRDILEQLDIPFSDNIQCYYFGSSGIDYIVNIG